MSNEITTANVQQYATNVELLLQQRGSRFRMAVNESAATGKAAVPVDQVGAVTAQKRTTRHGDTPLIETPHARPWCFPVDYEWADLIDNQDKLRTLIDPQSPYAQNAANAIRRAQDDEIITAFLAITKTGEDGTVDESFDTTNQQIAHGSVGMTVAKLREAKKKFLAAEVDIDNDPLFCALSAEQHDDLLGETQAISLDYNSRPVLVDGKITSFMGFNFIHSERLTVSTGATTRDCVAWAKSGMEICIWQDLLTRISERDDKSYSTQVYAATTVGAVRKEAGKVVNILCSE